MGLSMCTKLQLIVKSCARKTIENRLPRNEIRIHSSINCKQMASVNVKMVDHAVWTGSNNRKILFAALFSPLFWVLYFPMDNASGKIELSERYIKKLNCGHTLQGHDVVVLCRNNGFRTSSVTAVIVSP